MLLIRISQNVGLLKTGMNFTTVVVTKKKFPSIKLFLPLLPIAKNNKVLKHCHGATVTADGIKIILQKKPRFASGFSF